MLKFVQDIHSELGKTLTIKPPMRISGLFIETNNSAVANADSITDFGNIILNFQSKSIVGCDIAAFNDITNIFKGKPTFAQGADDSYAAGYATCDIAVIIPFSFPNIPNALVVDDDTEFNLTWRPNTAYAGTLSIYAIQSFNPESFVPYLLKVPETGDGRITMHSPMHNTYLAFVTPRDAADMVTVEKDKVAWLNAYASELLRFSEIEAKLEAGALTRFLLDFADTGIITDVLSDNVQIHVEHGAAGTSYAYFYCLDFVSKRIVKDIGILGAERSVKVSKFTSARPELATIIGAVSKPKIA